MKKSLFTALPLLICFSAAGPTAQAQAPRKPAPVKAAPVVPAKATLPFELGAYLYNQAYDTNLSGSTGAGTGKWEKYRAWLGNPGMSVEADPGWGSGDWWDCAQHVSWNSPWAAQQQRHGAALPTVILGIGQMPSDPNSSHSWEQKLAWENATWKAEAANDPAIMAYFANYAKEVNDLGFKSVVIRIGYEFDGGWNPFGNLNVMSDMPGNYIKAWQNIVKTMRANDRGHVIRGFFWNPTDGNVQIDQFAYYPGDDYTDFVGFDEYDFGYNGDYKASAVQPTQAQQDAAWKNMELPRINRFADLARTHNKKIILGEWGLWQLNDRWHPSGGDNPSYIQHMYDWMSDPKNRVAIAVYFETPSDGDSSLSGTFHPTTFPKSAALYRKLFGLPAGPVVPAGLTAAAGYGSAALSWQPSSGNPSPTYTVFRAASPSAKAVPVASGLSETSYMDTGLRNGATYYYSLQAANSVRKTTQSPRVSAKPGVPENYARNGGFETGDLSFWQVEGGSNVNAAYTEKSSGHTGTYVFTNWSASDYSATATQKILAANGPHTVSAWVRSSGGQDLCQMEISAPGAAPVVVPIPAGGDWHQVSGSIAVSKGTLQVGFHSKSPGNKWVNIDDVEVK